MSDRSCAICEAQLGEPLIELRDFPLTGLFQKAPPERPALRPRGFDLAFTVCGSCGHGQLLDRLDPRLIYDGTYSFRTSRSQTAQRGCEEFLRFLRSLAPAPRLFPAALDVGCNDLHLLRRLEPVAGLRVGIDPMWTGREEEAAEAAGPGGAGVRVLGDLLENLDLRSALDGPPDLVVCRHTIEHVADPVRFLRQLLDAGTEDTLYLFEFPGLELLIERCRFDQVFHQHLHYFSRRSFVALVERLGGRVLATGENREHWGSLLFAFARGPGPAAETGSFTAERAIDGCSRAYRRFREFMGIMGELTGEACRGRAFGYGAALMLPATAYHLGSDLDGLIAVLDDDPGKDGLHYSNLKVPIRRPEPSLGLEDATYLITAPESQRAILKRVLALGPRSIIVPCMLV